jgi:hypothetical protein
MTAPWKPGRQRRGESLEQCRIRQARENHAEVQRRLRTPVVTGPAEPPSPIPEGELPWNGIGWPGPWEFWP